MEAVDEYTLKLTFTSPTLPEEFLVDKNRDIYVLPTHLLQDIPPEELMTDDFWLALWVQAPASMSPRFPAAPWCSRATRTTSWEPRGLTPSPSR